MPFKIATGIDTLLWKKVVVELYQEGWKVIEKYENFDAGVDFDFILLRRSGMSAYFGWDYIHEGEIKAKTETLNYLSSKFKINFQYEEPKSLTAGVIRLTRLRTYFKRWSNSPEKFFREQFNIA